MTLIIPLKIESFEQRISEVEDWKGFKFNNCCKFYGGPEYKYPYKISY